jgi:hypothetical protein
MSAEPVVPVVRRKKHEMIADALAAAKLKQAMRPAVAPAVRPARARQMNLESCVIPGLPIVGFVEGTMILCKVGDVEQEVAVQDLRKDSLVKTSSNEFIAIHIIGSRAVTIPESADHSADRLYTLSNDKFPTLSQDLTISGRCAILIDKATDAQKKSTIDTMGRLSMIRDKFCLPVCVHADAVLSSTVGAVTLYNFSLDEEDPRTVHGVYANGLLVDHSPSYLMMSTEYTRLQ